MDVQDHGGLEPGRNRGRPNRRNITDIGTTYVHWMRNLRPPGTGAQGFEAERLSPSYICDMLPPVARKGRPADTIPARYLHSSLNKVRHPINVVKWTPEGRRLVTASTSGEFTLWNGTGFNFETIMQAHDAPVRALAYSHSDEWLISSDDEAVVKYWQSNFNNVKEIQAHEPGKIAAIRDLAFAPTDTKFVTASDDNTLKLFDFASGLEEAELRDHSWSVKSVDWHPTKGLLSSGGKDNQIKLWDPRTSRCLTTLHGHKNALNMVKFEPKNGVLLASCGRDNTSRVFDIRMMRDVFLLPAESGTSLAWHPIHSSLLTIATNGGEILHYLLDEQHPPAGQALTISPYDSPNPSDAPAQTIWPAHKTPFAHEYAIWSVAWHPLGHILVSGSNDRVTRFWTRPRPGDTTYINDRWHIGAAAADAQGTWRKSDAQRQREEEEAEAEDEADGLIDQKMPSKNVGLPGLAAAAAALPILPHANGSSSHPVGLYEPNSTRQPPSLGAAPLLPPAGIDLAKIMEIASNGGVLPHLALPNMPSNGAPAGFPPLPHDFLSAGAPHMQQLPPGVPPSAIPGFSHSAQGVDGTNDLAGGATPAVPALAPAPAATAAGGGSGGGGGGGVRRRAPLPSQKESLREEQRQGRFTKAR